MNSDSESEEYPPSNSADTESDPRSSTDCEFDTPGPSVRKKRRVSIKECYLGGEARQPFRISSELARSFNESLPARIRVSLKHLLVQTT